MSSWNPDKQVTAWQLPRPSHMAVAACWTVEHGVVLDAGGDAEHWPVAAAHVPGTWHWSLALHTTAGPAAHVPPEQVSGVVHALLSALHDVPFVAFG
jgi:hypothetical protein